MESGDISARLAEAQRVAGEIATDLRARASEGLETTAAVLEAFAGRVDELAVEIGEVAAGVAG
jgi:hypothetical protein